MAADVVASNQPFKPDQFLFLLVPSHSWWEGSGPTEMRSLTAFSRSCLKRLFFYLVFFFLLLVCLFNLFTFKGAAVVRSRAETFQLELVRP